MKPLNLNKDSCNPISSNCVVWQGPDIECINLCKGDSVTEVVFKLATELCELLEQFKVSNYDISCFNLIECDPKDFAALIQLLIDRVCACCEYDPCTNSYVTAGTATTVTGTTTGCPDCQVTVCPSFYYENPQGDTITTMQVQDYAIAIGNRVCQMIGQIDTINATLAEHEQRIVILEAAPPPVLVLPKITPDCVLPATPTDIDVVLQALEEQFCLLRTATGDPSQIYAAIIKQCAGLNGSPQLSGSGNMQDITGWAAVTANGADAFSNLWLTICDLRASIQNIQANCCDTGCDTITFAITATLLSVNQLELTFTGSIPGNFGDCNVGSAIVLTDGQGGTTTLTLNLISNHINQSPYVIDLNTVPLDGNYNINAIATLCALDVTSGTTCQNVATATASASQNCPVINLIPTSSSLQYQFIYQGTVPSSGTVELWNTSQTVMLQSQFYNFTTANQSVIDTFSTLNSGTVYYIRLVITGNNNCPFEEGTTTAQGCLPPTNGGIIEL